MKHLSVFLRLASEKRRCYRALSPRSSERNNRSSTGTAPQRRLSWVKRRIAAPCFCQEINPSSPWLGSTAICSWCIVEITRLQLTMKQQRRGRPSIAVTARSISPLLAVANPGTPRCPAAARVPGSAAKGHVGDLIKNPKVLNLDCT